jgi:hypothetical protein
MVSAASLRVLGLRSNAAWARSVLYTPRNALRWSLPSVPIHAIEHK